MPLRKNGGFEVPANSGPTLREMLASPGQYPEEFERMRQTVSNFQQLAADNVIVLRGVAETARKLLTDESLLGMSSAVKQVNEYVNSAGFRAAMDAYLQGSTARVNAQLVSFVPAILAPPAPVREPEPVAPTSDVESELEGMRWLNAEVLADNDRWRYATALFCLALGQALGQIRQLKFDAMMGWGTLPYPRLDAEDFDGLERQP